MAQVKKDVNRNTNAATRDGDSGGARQWHARKQSRRSRRRRWLYDQKNTGRKRGRGHSERRRLAWTSALKWQRVFEAAIARSGRVDKLEVLKAVGSAWIALRREEVSASSDRKGRVLMWGDDMLREVGQSASGNGGECVEGDCDADEEEWAALLDSMRTAVDLEWRTEGKYYNSREWKKREKIAS